MSIKQIVPGLYTINLGKNGGNPIANCYLFGALGGVMDQIDSVEKRFSWGCV